MRICYLTCGFVNLTLLDAASKSPKTIISYLDPAKRLEAYPAGGGVPLKAEGIRGFLATEWDRNIIIDAVANVRVRSASSSMFHQWQWLGFEVLATIPEMPRHSPIPG